MDVLADCVGRRIDLEIVEVEYAGHQVGALEHDALARIGAEEEGFGGAIERVADRTQRVLDILVEDDDPRLRVMPARAVHRHVELDITGAIGAFDQWPIGVDPIVARRGGTWIGVRRARLGPMTVDREQEIAGMTRRGRVTMAGGIARWIALEAQLEAR